MNICLINKESHICENIAAVDTMEAAQEMFGSIYYLTEQVVGYGIGDKYENNKWFNAKPEPEPEPEPAEDDDLIGLIVDHEYRLTLIELGV